MKTSRFMILLVVMTLAWPLVATTQGQSAEARLQAAINKETVDGDLKTAIELYRQLEDSPNHAVAAKALLRMGECYEKRGDSEARKAYERVVARFPDQTDVVAEARRRLTAKNGAARPETGVVEHQICAFSDSPDVGGVSADGRYVVLIYFDAGGNRIALRDLASGEERIVADKTECYSALLSPDGRQIACNCDATLGRRDVEHPARTELRLLRADGSGSRTLLSGAEWYTPADWSPDGKYLLARVSRLSGERASAPADMVLVSLVDGSERVLKSGGGVAAGASSPRFSPDGRYIVHPAVRVDREGKKIANNDHGRGTLHIMRADGSGEVPLVSGVPTELHWSPVWTPDGRHIVFHSDRSGTRALWAQRVVDGKPQGEPELLNAQAGEDWPVGFTREGTLYCLRYQGRSDIRIAEIDPQNGKLISQQPSRLNQGFVGSSYGPLAWSPDGKQLAFNRYANSKMTLVLHSMDTAAERELPGAPSEVTNWFPDGESLLAGWKKVDVATGRADALTVLPTDIGRRSQNPAPTASRDCMTLYYSVSEKASGPNEGTYSVRLIRRRIDTGEEKAIYETISRSSFLHSLALSPDDRELTFGEVVGPGSVLKIVSTDGGTSRELLPKFAFGARWSKDGRYVLARGTWTDGKVQLLAVPVDGGQVRPTGLRVGDWFALHPDGRHIAFQDGSDGAAIVAIKNLLPAR